MQLLVLLLEAVQSRQGGQIIGSTIIGGYMVGGAIGGSAIVVAAIIWVEAVPRRLELCTKHV